MSARERDSQVAQVSVVEWDQPDETAEEDGEVMAALSVMMQYDSTTGEVWARVQLGSTYAYFRPSTLGSALFEMWGLAADFENCHWDLEQKACTSTSCKLAPGPKHIGRLVRRGDGS